MKNSIFNAVCKTRYLALLVVLIFTCGNAWGEVWIKVTSAPTSWEGEYLLVNEDANVAWTGVDATSCGASVTISSGKISSKPASAVTLTLATITGGYSIKINGGTNNGKYIGKSANSNGMDIGTTAVKNTLTYDGDNSCITITGAGGAILRYNNSSDQKRFRYFKSSSYTSQKKIQLYKKYYTVTYNKNGGDGTMTDSNSPYAPNAIVTVLTNTFTAPSGKIFDKWNTKANGSGNDFVENATFTISKDTTFYAQWKSAASCTTNPTVSASSNSSVTATTATVTCSSGISSLGSAGCSISSYGFVMNTTGNPTISDTKHEVGQTYTTTGTLFYKDLTGLTAETTYYVRAYATNGNGTAYGTQTSFTTLALPKYTVTLKDDDTELTQASYGASVTLPSRAGCSGYTFAGWSTTNNTSWTTTAPTIINAGSYTPTANIDLYPVYTKTEGGGTTETTVTETFTNQTSHSSVTDWKQTLTWDASESNASIEWTTYYGKITSGYTEIRTYNDNVMGYLWTSEPITGLKKVKFKGWHVTDTDAANMVVSYSTDNDTWYELGTHAATSDNSTFSDEFEITSSDPSTAYYLSIDLSDATCPSSSNKKYRIDDIVITTETGGGSTTYYISVPDCCTDWSTPTVSYSSSLAIGGTESVTISSGTTHGALTYESSNEDILTVESDGTITAVGAGTAHIIATWAGDATYCEKSANSNDITVSGIEITGTLPVNFGQVYQNAVIGNKTLSVTGLGLTNAITPSLPSGSPFSFSPNSFAANADHATLTISANTATIGEYSHTLTLTSGTFTATATINMNVVAMPSCTFVDNLHNLTVDKNGVSLSNYDLTAAAGTSVVFPVLANQEKGVSTCEEQHYVFVGWTTSDDNDHPENHLVTSHNLENGDNITYYAVWADGVAGVSYTKLTSSTFKTSPTKYVIGADDGEGTDLFFYSCEKTDQNNSWGYVSSDPSTDAPIQFTLSGTASELVATSTEATARYLNPASGKQFFGMSATSKAVVLGESGTIESTADTYNNLRYNYNSGSGGLRWYTGTNTGTAAYFYEVVAGNTPSYRTSCCANKVPAPTVTATKTSTTITLSWNDLSGSGATGYEVSWNGGAYGSPSGTRTHTVIGLTPNTSYTWQVRATYTDPKCGADIASGSTTTNQVYHVTYAKGDESANCNATGSTTDATAYEAGAAVTLQANGFTLHGYDFNVWTTDDPDVTISSNQFTMPDHDVVITASWTAKVDKYFDRMHDQTDALHGGIEETESGPNEGKYYIQMTGCNYSVPTAVDSKTGDACQTSHYKLRGWIAASYMKGYPDHMDGTVTQANLDDHLFQPIGTKTATGATYYAIWAKVVE